MLDGMRGLGFGLMVMTITVGALATEPEAPTFPYAILPLGRLARPVPCTVFEVVPPPARPLRLWLTNSDSQALEEKSFSAQASEVDPEIESIASFPIESEADASLVLNPHSRLLGIRTTFDDGVAACSFLPPRLFRRAFEEPSDAAPASIASRVRTSLD